MSLPPSFSGMPVEEQRRYYRNVCISFRKTIKSTTSLPLLQEEIDRFLSASREVQWPNSANSGKFHKNGIEKAVQKVANEFRRYVQTLEKEPEKAQNEDLLNALALVETEIDQLKIR